MSLLCLFETVSNDCVVEVNETGTRLKYKPGIIMGGKNLVNSCVLTRSMGYYLEPVLLLGLFGKKPLSIRLKGSNFPTSSNNAKPVYFKITFLFLTPGTLPFEKLWDEFFTDHEGKFSVYIHPSKERPVHVSSHFSDREIHSDEVTWGRISMVDAEKRLLVSALEDPDNQHFVLLSES